MRRPRCGGEEARARRRAHFAAAWRLAVDLLSFPDMARAARGLWARGLLLAGVCRSCAPSTKCRLSDLKTLSSGKVENVCHDVCEPGWKSGGLQDEDSNCAKIRGGTCIQTWFVELPQLTLRGHHKGPHCPFATRLFLSWR